MIYYMQSITITKLHVLLFWNYSITITVFELYYYYYYSTIYYYYYYYYYYNNFSSSFPKR